jgi:glycerophosphoryl diester phosphodiesterase
MEIISHRGYWKDASEKNEMVAFERSFSLGFGTETDFRDYAGELVISHDIAIAQSIKAVSIFELYNKHKLQSTLALNIKADSLQVQFNALLKKFEIANYFVFDMSIPDTIGYINQGIGFYSRQSEYEPQPAFYEECNGVWLDAFNSTWYNSSLILEHIRNNKQVAMVSPELHKRDYLPLWQQLRSAKLHQQKGVILCTDYPELAKDFFKD